MNSKKRVIVESVISTILLGLLVYAAYSLWYVFYGKESSLEVHLYTVLSGSALGWFLSLFVGALFQKANWIPRLIAFILGNGIFQAIIWGTNAKLNTEQCTDNDPVVIRTFSITFVIVCLLVLVTFILRAKKGFKVLNGILAAVYFVISCGGAVVFNIDNIKALEYKKNIEFGSVSHEEMQLNKNDKALCTQWLDDHFKDGKLPFSFKLDGKDFDPSQWNIEIKKDIPDGKEYLNGKTKYIVLTNKDNKLQVTAELTLFDNSATCQWVVYIRNNGKKNSPVISDFYAMDSSVATGKADIYYSMGSDTAASDFSLIKKELSSKVMEFGGNEGKPTEKYLSYFNLCGENMGAVVGIGWTGQWASSFALNEGETDITVKQESFSAYLLPGEEVRSPLVSVSFYKNENPLKGFNLFRSWIMDSVYPESVTQNQYTVMEVAGPVSERTSDEIIDILNNEVDPDVYNQIDAFWMDAGWYEYNEGWHDGAGNWTVDTKRYDEGIVELSDYAKKKGLGHVLWYEPERLFRDTVFYNEGIKHEGWLIDIGEDNVMWNLADEEALDYYCKYLVKSMKENGVTIYRQDFNFAPLSYWQKADAELYDGRTGICENHYVTNLYRYLDYLYENIDGLIIDNCASGGKRLDLEMTYRSIAFWRSDYNCSYHADLFEATQSHTYGISFWLPITGSALYMEDEYASRSDIMPLMLMDFFSHKNPEFSYNKEPRELMTGNYYPIEFGSFDKDKMHAVEFISTDGKEGTALVYKREDVLSNNYTVKLNGLVPDAEYEIYDIDAPDKVYTLSGESLMSEGLETELPDGEKALIFMFRQVK